MAVSAIQEFKQLNGKDILKVSLSPTKNFPSGAYFYADVEDLDIVTSQTWYLHPSFKKTYVEAGSKYRGFKFSQELALKHLGRYVENIMYLNQNAVDNTTDNLSVVSDKEVQQASYCLGYRYSPQTHLWTASITLETSHTKRVRVSNEIEACMLRRALEVEYYRHPYNFLGDRGTTQGAIELLDLERTGQITHEESIYRHVLSYADNAWYYYRFNLAEYFTAYHIPVPPHTLDDKGFLVHPVTGQRLAPLV